MPPRILPLLVATALLLFGNGVVVAILPLRWALEGVSAETIAFIGSANYFGMLLGAACGPALVRRLGGRGAGMVFAIVIAASTLLVLAVSLPTAYGLARLAGGFGLTGLYLVIEAELNALARPDCRTRVLALYMIVFYLAQAGGAAVSGGAAETPLLIGASVLFLLSGLPLPSGDRAIPPAGTSIGATARLWRLAPHGYLAAFAAGILFGCFYALGPLYAQASTPAPGAAGRFMAVAMLGGVAAMMPIAVCADRQGRILWLAAVNLMVAGVSAWLVAAAPAGLIAGFVFGAVGLVCYPLASAAVNEATSQELRLPANGLVVQLSAIGGCLGPLASGALTPWFGPAAAFVVIGTASALTATALFFRVWKP